jgi:hypothetical protein
MVHHKISANVVAGWITGKITANKLQMDVLLIVAVISRKLAGTFKRIAILTITGTSFQFAKPVMLKKIKR